MLPLTQRMQAAHLAEYDLLRIWLLERTSLVRCQRLFPAVQLFVPFLVMRDVHVLARIRERAERRVALLQLGVDVDEQLDDLRRRLGHELGLLVVQGFGVRMELVRTVAQQPDTDWQRLVVVFHELGQV